MVELGRLSRSKFQWLGADPAAVGDPEQRMSPSRDLGPTSRYSYTAETTARPAWATGFYRNSKFVGKGAGGPLVKMAVKVVGNEGGSTAQVQAPTNIGPFVGVTRATSTR